MRGDANVLDQAARCALRAYSRQDAELQATDHGAVTILRDHQLDILIAVDPLERQEIGWRQRILEPFARAAERIVRQHPNDDADIIAPGAPDGDRGSCSHCHSG
jgi:hypothetical protein